MGDESGVGRDKSWFYSWLQHPLSGWWCLAGWCAATIVFFGIVKLLGGTATIDTYQSVFSTWSIAHGQLTCAFPPGFRVIPPMYPLLSGGIAAIGHFGSSVPFPSGSTYGTHCSHAFTSINVWSLKADAVHPTTNIAYISWPILMAGVIAFLRSANRGRCGWEPSTILTVAVLPPVWLTIEGTFHPQDLIAMGFALAAIACVLRDRWIGAGILIALAILSQQFALLVAAPLLVIAPRNRTLPFAGTAIGTGLIVAFPFFVTNFRGALDAVVFGTGNTGGIGGTVLWELNLHGALLVLLSRILPIALGLVAAAWARRHLGRGALEAAPLIALVALSLSFRLVFEQQLFGYYYMALCVALVVLDVVRGRFRISVFAWIATLSMVYLITSDALSSLSPGWQSFARSAIPVGVIVLGCFLIVRDLRGGRWHWFLAAWAGMIVAALLTWGQTNVLGAPPTWFWQVVFVPFGAALAAGPLLVIVGEDNGNKQTFSGTISPRPTS